MKTDDSSKYITLLSNLHIFKIIFSIKHILQPIVYDKYVFETAQMYCFVL